MAEHPDTTYHSNPFRAMMIQLSMVLKANPISVLTLGLLMLVVIFGGFFLISLFAGLFHNAFGVFLALLFGIAYFIFVIFRFTAASYLLHFASREGRSLTAMQAFDEAGKGNFKKYLLTSLATGAIILVGFVLLIIPGLYLLGRLLLAPYIALNEGSGVMDSLKRSWKLSEGHWFEVFASTIASAVTIPSGLLSFSGGQSGTVGRYYELVELEKSGAKAPQTHWMNYLLTGFAFVFMLFYGLVIRNAGNLGTTKHYNNCADDVFIDCTNNSGLYPPSSSDLNGNSPYYRTPAN